MYVYIIIIIIKGDRQGYVVEFFYLPFQVHNLKNSFRLSVEFGKYMLL